MSLRKKRAAVVVPTAFLVALSGFGAAPALATDGGTPAAIVNDQADEADTDVAAGRSAAVTFTQGNPDRLVPPADGQASDDTLFDAGDYWLEQTVQAPAANGTTPAPVKTYARVTLTAPAQITHTVNTVGPEGTTTTVTLYSVQSGLADPAALNQAQRQQVLADTPNTVNEDTVEIRAVAPLAITGTSPVSLNEGDSGVVAFNQLNIDRDYAVLNNGVLQTVADKAPSVSVPVNPQNGAAGTWTVALYDIQANADYEAATTDAARVEVLKRLVPVATRTVTINAVNPSVVTTPATPVVAGNNATVTFANLDAPATDAQGNATSYRYQIVRNGQNVGEAQPATLTDDGNGFSSVAVQVPTARDAMGDTYQVRLTNPNGTSLTGDVKVQPVKVDAPTQVQDRDAIEVVYSQLGNGDYVLVGKATSGNAVTTTVQPRTTANNTITENVTAADSNVGTYEYDLFVAPTAPAYTGLTGTSSEDLRVKQIAYLEANGDKVAENTVTVVANAARAVATPATFAATGTPINIRFENIPGKQNGTETSAVLSANDYEVLLTTTDAAGKQTVSRQEITVDPANGSDLTIPTFNSVDGFTYSATLYNVPTGTYLNADNQNALIAAAGAVKDAAGRTLTATSADRDIVAPVVTKVTAPAPTFADNVVTIPVKEGVEYLIDGKVVAAGTYAIEKDVVVTARATTGFELEGTKQWEFAYVAPVTERAWTGRSLSGAEIPTAFHAIPTSVKGADIFAGDWNGDGIDTPGYRTGANTFRLAATNDYDTTWSADITFGKEGDQIFVGDWDGNGTQTLGLRRGITVYLNNQNIGGNAEIAFDFGRVGDDVLVGDWDQDGTDTIGLRRGITNYLSNDFEGGWAEDDYTFGRAGDRMLVGDWDGDGVDTLASRRGNVYYVNNNHEGGWVNGASLGTANQPAVVTNVEKDGKDEIFVLAVDDVEVPTQD